MPGYSEKAQPYLDAIAAGVFTSQAVRDWLIKGTPVAASYLGSRVLIDEQQMVRWHSKATKQPFWANYWCGRDSRCTCRIEGSKALESDAIFFLQNDADRILAIHVEFKHPNETFGYGQPEGYALRAACFAKTHHERRTLNAHDDWTTVLFCGAEVTLGQRSHFQRVITHEEAARIIATYPPMRGPRVVLSVERLSKPQPTATGVLIPRQPDTALRQEQRQLGFGQALHAETRPLSRSRGVNVLREVITIGLVLIMVIVLAVLLI